jgi:hypothetical protein
MKRRETLPYQIGVEIAEITEKNLNTLIRLEFGIA